MNLTIHGKNIFILNVDAQEGERDTLQLALT